MRVNSGTHTNKCKFLIKKLKNLNMHRMIDDQVLTEDLKKGIEDF